MIDKDQFAIGMGLLGGAFSRDLDAAVSAAYYRILNQRLTTEQFVRSVELTLESERYWPSPAVLLEKVGAMSTDDAERALRAVNALIGKHGGVQFVPYAAFNELDAATKAAVLEVGGLAKIAGTSEEKWPALSRKFAEAYRRALDVPRLLPPAPAEPDARAEQLVSDLAERRSLRAS